MIARRHNLPAAACPPPLADPRALAVEHVAWCRRQNISLAELHASLGHQAGPHFHCWRDAISRLTRIAADMAMYLADRPRRRRQPPNHDRQQLAV